MTNITAEAEFIAATMISARATYTPFEDAATAEAVLAAVRPLLPRYTYAFRVDRAVVTKSCRYRR